MLQYVSHGVSKRAAGGGGAETPAPAGARAGFGEPGELPDDPLAAYATNLTERAAQGKLDPLIGRGAELDRIVHILARRRKNNPILVGETGVGKTALAEGLALRVREGRVPEDMREAEIFSLDIGAMLAGTRYRGDFEARFKAFMAALARAPASHPLHRRDPHHPRRGLGAGRDRRRVEHAEADPPAAASCAAWARRPTRSTGTSSATARCRGASSAST